MKNLLQNTTQLAQAIWEHYLSPQLASGEYAAVDATCGRGNDTVWLAARCGRVYAFDIQPEAIAAAREALHAADIGSTYKASHAADIGSTHEASHAADIGSTHKASHAADISSTHEASHAADIGSTHKVLHAADISDAPAAAPAVTLIEDSHANLAGYIDGPIGLIVFNLGYLPGGDKERTTVAASTLTALQAAADRLAVGGLLSVTLYWGHEAGKAEREAVLAWAAELDRSIYHCVHTDMLNQPNCPPEILFVTRKR